MEDDGITFDMGTFLAWIAAGITHAVFIIMDGFRAMC